MTHPLKNERLVTPRAIKPAQQRKQSSPTTTLSILLLPVSSHLIVLHFHGPWRLFHQIELQVCLDTSGRLQDGSAAQADLDGLPGGLSVFLLGLWNHRGKIHTFSALQQTVVAEQVSSETDCLSANPALLTKPEKNSRRTEQVVYLPESSVLQHWRKISR